MNITLMRLSDVVSAALWGGSTIGVLFGDQGLKSIAGGISVAGALFFVVHLVYVRIYLESKKQKQAMESEELNQETTKLINRIKELELETKSDEINK